MPNPSVSSVRTAIIIAGGKNARFFPLNTSTHKGFLSIAGKPLVIRAVENLKSHGFKKIVIVVSDKDYEGKGLSSYLKTHGLESDISLVLQDEAKGMGDALLRAKSHLDGRFVLSAPYHTKLGELATQLETERQTAGADCVFFGTQTDTPELYGILKFDSANPKKVLGVVEKPQRGAEPSKYKIDSVYLLDAGFIQELESTAGSENSFEAALTAYAAKKNVSWIENTQETKSLKYPWHIFGVFEQLMAAEKTAVSPSAQVAKTAVIDDSRGPVIIAEGARIGDFAKLVGPCYVGKNCLVGDYSFIRGSSIEEGAQVGANSEIARSILFEKSSLHYGYLADSIIGHETTVGAGLITANKLFSRKNIQVEVQGQLVDTGRQAMGFITGEKVTIGIRVSTMPGLLIGSEAVIYPNTLVTKSIKANETVTWKDQQ